MLRNIEGTVVTIPILKILSVAIPIEESLNSIVLVTIFLTTSAGGVRVKSITLMADKDVPNPTTFVFEFVIPSHKKYFQ